MSRLPTPGGDDGAWGDILNDFLNRSHNTDGSLKPAAVTAAGAITSAPVSSVAGKTGAVTLAESDITNLSTDLGAKVVKGDLVINVKDYGATGNGTTDDSTSIQNAINAATFGSTVFFPTGTYLISSTISLKQSVRYVGSHRQYTVIKAANGSNLDAVLSAAEWLNTSGTPGTADGPISIEHLSINGNKDNQTGGSGTGLVLISFWNHLADIQVGYTYGDGVRITCARRDGTQITGTAVETHLSRVDIRFAGGYGVRVAAPNGPSNQVTTDGWMVDCVVQTSTNDGVRIDSGAGWLISGCHFYGCKMSAININNAIDTRVVNNYVESWGTSTTVGTYTAIALGDGINTFMGASYGSVISGNTLFYESGAVVGTTINGIASTASSAVSKTAIIISDNSIYNAFSFWTGIKIAIQSGGTGTFNVRVSGNLLQGWATPFAMTSASGTVSLSGDVHNPALSTTATSGFTQLPGTPGTPSGTPSDTTRGIPVTVNTSTNALYAYYGSAWQALGSAVTPATVTSLRSAKAASGNYLVTANSGSTSTSVGPWTLGQVYLTPLTVQATQTFTGLSTNMTVQAAGGTSPLIIMGLYNDDGTGTKPTGSIISGSQVSFNPVTQATGNADIAFSSAIQLTAGTYWAAWVVTSGSALGTNPTMVTLTPLGNTVLSTLANSSAKGWIVTTSSSATSLPSGISPVVGFGAWPIIGLKAQ